MDEKNQKMEQHEVTDNPELFTEDEQASVDVSEEKDPMIELKLQIDELQNRNLRLQADFDNFRKRSRKEKEDWMKYASQPVIEALLPVLDNLERALAVSYDSSNVESLLKGVEMVYRQINQVLVQEGLQVIEAEGKPFDPTYHQAVMQEESAEYDSGIVLQELQKGYTMKDRVVRPSMVKVSS